MFPIIRLIEEVIFVKILFVNQKALETVVLSGGEFIHITVYLPKGNVIDQNVFTGFCLDRNYGE